MNRKAIWIFLMVAIFFGIVLWNVGGSRVLDIAPYYAKRIVGETGTVQIQGRTIKVELARTSSARLKGLSGRHYLDQSRGMLFLFPEAGMYQFTMANTDIPLDIIWLHDNRIVHIAADIQPGVTAIDPGVAADAVLEVNGLTAQHSGWQVGAQVTVTFDKKK